MCNGMRESRTPLGAFLGLPMMACFGLLSGLACRYCLMLSKCVGLCEAVLRSFLVLLEVVIGALLYMASYNSTRIRRGDTKNYVRWCSWISLLRLLKGLHVHRCSWLFADGCRRSCHDSCQALSNDMMGRFELSANVLYVFVVTFCVLKLSARCLCLRSIFRLNMLALLHCCYM
jgi:hypothetical protein